MTDPKLKSLVVERRLPNMTVLRMPERPDGPPTWEFAKLTGISHHEAIWFFPALARIRNAMRPLRYVYFAAIRGTDAIKIGVAWDVDRRLKELHKGELRREFRARGFDLWGAVPGDRKEEWWTHRRFAAHRIPRHLAPVAGNECFRLGAIEGEVRKILERGYLEPHSGDWTYWKPREWEAA
jgi:hypothetical protein